MKVSVNWLRRLTGVAATADEIARRLTAAGLEVEGTTRLGGFIGVVVAEVVAKRKHPSADKLTLVDVIDGSGTTTQVVCGAPNVPDAGGKVAWARPGARLPDGRVLEPREVRGVVSPGMLCAEDELGLGESHEGIILLDAGAQPGDDVAPLLGLPDTILELNVTPNRPDCLGHVGVARELVALFPEETLSLRLGDAAFEEGGPEIATMSSVELVDAAGCPRYLARVVEGIAIGPSPLAVRLQLQALGVRAINNVVDATNLSLLETGHPLHAFDLDKLAGHRIVVRAARPGEIIVTLDGQERALGPDDVAICDAERPVAVAGIMGGRDSEVTQATTRILLESAYFDGGRIRRTGRRLGLHTEAAHRFERGADPNAGVEYSSRRCTHLIVSLAGGRVARGALDAYPAPIAPVRLTLRPARTDLVMGMHVPVAEQVRRLAAIGITAVEGAYVECTVPTFRPDVTREIDLIEEVARLGGIDGVPATLPPLRAIPRDRHDRRPERVRDALVALGFSEAITYSFVHPGMAAPQSALDGAHDPIRIENPLRLEQSALRQSLLAGLFALAGRNLAHGIGDQRVFEVGTVFPPRDAAPGAAAIDTLPRERRHVAGVLVGRRPSTGEKDWLKPGESVDFYDVKGVVDALLGALRAPAVTWHTLGADRAGKSLHPLRSAMIVLDGVPIGVAGELHPDSRREMLERSGLDIAAVAFEIDLSRVGAPRGVRAGELPRFPGSSRDLSFFVARGVPSADLEAAMRGISELLVEMRPLEDYREDRVPSDKKGMLYTLSYRATDRTLTDDEINRAHARVVDALKARFAVEMR